ncbi:DNA-directed RNA polymerase III subunit rpc1 [Tritrichomonas foetus]|uniref:DNA-directed RNA polymerase subunit n=1 Tax=Tritrichomonas foetus TaxID=1144522 RepID=A0A1J4K6P0_9EUKA|nr:DNA-directed RNA polymerase III subunit rpc1 [Tritrichomonas foetus]|eukprot:OHT06560.1 DNA-directed RNA polymerase III subunit rpc1 [Tritrichomonas foetus]
MEFKAKTLVPTSNAPKRVKELDFTILGAKEIRKMSAASITKCDFYEPTSNKPVSGGVVDLRFGTTSREFSCQTCGQNSHDCPGHFGSIELLFPVFNPGYYPHIINTLKCICKTCSHILLPKNDINRRLRRLYSTRTTNVYSRIERMKALIAECIKVTVCPHCGAFNGAIRKTKNLLIINHFIGVKNEGIKNTFTDQFSQLQIPDQISFDQICQNVCEDLTPVRVLHLFDNIPAREIPLLTYTMKVGHPADMIVRSFIVPPNAIRPSVISPGEGSTEDDLTIRVREAIDNTIQLQKAVDAGITAKVVAEKWNSMQQIINTLVNSEGPDTLMKKNKKDKAVIGLAQRLKGKHGRFRNNLSGKRVDFSGRTVISPDPNANVDQVVVPLEMAMTLTFPTVVTKYNIKLLKKCIRNGPNKYPGANLILHDNSQFKRSLKYIKPSDLNHILDNLKYGDVVDRHLMNDDIILFNRQPSLHRISVMVFRAKVMPWRTLRFNVCACSPFNADFDGDEMNVHLPQTLEAAADAKILMNVLHNLFSPRSGELIVAPTQDFLSGSYLLTRKNVFLDYSQFSFLAAQIFDSDVQLEIPMPAILMPTPLWTGKQLISLMIKPNSSEKFNFTHNVTNKEYNGNLHMDKNDGYVSFMDSVMLSGVLEKSLIGGGGKSLFATLARDVSPNFAATCMARIAKVSVRYLMNRGFSIGITDVTPTEKLEVGKASVIRAAYEKSTNAINQLNAGNFPAAPGMTAELSLERLLNETLSQVRNQIGKICLRELSNLNTALVMAKSGAKGSDINISQMMACVGQQIISGQRVIVDFIDRTIPHFHHHSLEPTAKGFVANSFFSGLEPYEFFFHTMSGREGLVDAAVKTAETGYLQRRLMKSLEDATVQYDGTVRMADQSIIQFRYGDDGLDPLVMETRSYPIDLKRVSFELMNKNREGRIITPREAYNIFLGIIGPEREKPNLPFNVPSFLLDTFEGFFKKEIIGKYTDLLNSFKTPDCLREVMNNTIEELLQREKELIDVQVPLHEDAQNIAEERKQVQEKYHTTKIALMKLKNKDRSENGYRDRQSQYQSARRKIEREYQDAIKELDSREEQLKLYFAENTKFLEPVIEEINQFLIDSFEPRIRAMFAVTEDYVTEFTTNTLRRLEKSIIEPGSTVGAVAGQSIGEPATQMTLRSFHFAGVASMNVTLGVPRIQEVMNALKKIKTPVIEAKLNNDSSETAARVMKGMIDKILLGQVTKSIREIQTRKPGCYIEITLDFGLIYEAKLNITRESVMDRIASSKKLGVKPENIKGGSESNIIIIQFTDLPPSILAFKLQQLLLKLPSVPVSGLEGVNRVLISTDEDKKEGDPGKYKLFVESSNYLNVLTRSGIDWKHTKSNHILDVEQVLGIEAARSVIVNEINNVYENYSLAIDQRHLLLLADTMTMKGRINGINRHGLAKTCSSSLKLASFEVTMEHLYNAGFHQIQDSATDISSSVILGSFAKIGSGMCDILIADDLIKEPVLTPPLSFLTPQPPSELREKIAAGEIEMPKSNSNSNFI